MNNQEKQSKKKYKILHVITKLPIGGAQDNTLLTVAGLVDLGHTVHVASSPGGDWEERARQSCQALHQLPTMKREMSPLNDLRCIWDLVKLIRQHRYDIVHTHSSKAGILGRIAARIARTKTIVHTVHGFPFNDLTFSPKRRKLYLRMEQLGAKLAHHLVMVAKLNQQEALRNKIGSAENQTVIYSGIRLDPFDNLLSQEAARTRLNLPQNTPIIGFVGRLAGSTAPLLFAQAANQLLDCHPDLHAVVVGDGELRPELEAALGQHSRVHMLGFREDIAQILPALTVFVSSNMWAGLGRAITEAQAASLPVVAFPINGVPELIIDGETGLHAAVGDADDLAQKVCHLLTHPRLAQQMGEAGRDRVYADFSSQTMVEATAALYDRLV